MTTTEILILIQTVVLFLTGLSVYWYTLETNKIRKSTDKQNSLLSQQLLFLQEKDEFDRKKEISFIEPIFRYSGARYGTNESVSSFINEGGTIKNIEVRPTEKFNIKIEPRNIIRAGERGKIIFSNYPKPNPEKLNFEISYENQMGITSTQRFDFFPSKGKFSESKEKNKNLNSASS